MTTPLPPDPTGHHQNCARWAEEALRAYAEITGCRDEDPQTQVGDLIADLMHFCDRAPDTDFDDALQWGRYHYTEDIAGKDL